MASSAVPVGHLALSPLGHPAPVSGHPGPIAARRRAGRFLPPRGLDGRFVRAPASEPLSLVAPAAAASEGAKKRPSPAADDQDDAACPPVKRQRTPVKREETPATIKVEDEEVLASIEVVPAAFALFPPPNTRATVVLGKRRKVIREVYLSSRVGCPARPRPTLKLRVTQRGRTRLVRDIVLTPRVFKRSPEV